MCSLPAHIATTPSCSLPTTLGLLRENIQSLILSSQASCWNAGKSASTWRCQLWNQPAAFILHGRWFGRDPRVLKKERTLPLPKSLKPFIRFFQLQYIHNLYLFRGNLRNAHVGAGFACASIVLSVALVETVLS